MHLQKKNILRMALTIPQRRPMKKSFSFFTLEIKKNDLAYFCCQNKKSPNQYPTDIITCRPCHFSWRRVHRICPYMEMVNCWRRRFSIGQPLKQVKNLQHFIWKFVLFEVKHSSFKGCRYWA